MIIIVNKIKFKHYLVKVLNLLEVVLKKITFLEVVIVIIKVEIIPDITKAV